LFLLRTRKKIAMPIATKRAIPPTTPPTMAPIGADCAGCGVRDIEMVVGVLVRPVAVEV